MHTRFATTRVSPRVRASGERTANPRSQDVGAAGQVPGGTWVGRTVGEVHIERLLGRGGMADVYLGTHPGLNRRVAVKNLHEPMRRDPGMMKFFRDEADALTNMQHPNVVQQVVWSTGEALDHAHARGIVHRDIKPANIMLLGPQQRLQAELPLPADVQVVVADFGLAQLAHATSTSDDDVVIGTPAYMSPEQAVGGAADSRSDVYALGVVLYEMLAGRLPFRTRRNSMAEILFAHAHLRPHPVPNLTSAVQRVVDRALAKRPAERFASAGELAAALEAGARTQAARFQEAGRTALPKPVPSSGWRLEDPVRHRG